MDRYPQVSAISQTADRQAPGRRGAQGGGGIVAHSCGKGNDRSVRSQVRLLAPDLEVLAPVATTRGREEKAIAFAEENAIPDQRLRSPIAPSTRTWGARWRPAS